MTKNNFKMMDSIWNKESNGFQTFVHYFFRITYEFFTFFIIYIITLGTGLKFSTNTMRLFSKTYF